METSRLIRELAEQRAAWKSHQAALDKVTARLENETNQAVARSRELLHRVEDRLAIIRANFL
jgi:hypothetical protein